MHFVLLTSRGHCSIALILRLVKRNREINTIIFIHFYITFVFVAWLYLSILKPYLQVSAS